MKPDINGDLERAERELRARLNALHIEEKEVKLARTSVWALVAAVALILAAAIIIYILGVGL